MGSILGLVFLLQAIRGVLLTFFYSSRVGEAFRVISSIIRDSNRGWLIRTLHSNIARGFFLFVYLHIRRGLYYSRYRLSLAWSSGVIIYLLLIGISFLGYVLPWGQISLWGATVITNFLSVIPYVGGTVVEWVWGGYSIRDPTLKFFFSIHFLSPFVLMGIIVLHLVLLHFSGSSNPTGRLRRINKIKFDPLFTIKDSINLLLLLTLLFFILLYPWTLGDPENFIPSTPSRSPLHIQPEWYFLYLYALLRAIPNKLGGVLVMLLALIMLLILLRRRKELRLRLTPFRLLFWGFLTTWVLLTWLGRQVIEYPFTQLSQLTIGVYFTYFLLVIYSSSLIKNLFTTSLRQEQ